MTLRVLGIVLVIVAGVPLAMSFLGSPPGPMELGIIALVVCFGLYQIWKRARSPKRPGLDDGK